MVKPIWILLKQETVSGSDISWAICKSALRSRQITVPAPGYFWQPYLSLKVLFQKKWRKKTLEIQPGKMVLVVVVDPSHMGS